MTGAVIKGKFGHRHTVCENMKAEIRVTLPQAKEHLTGPANQLKPGGGPGADSLV